MRCCTSAEAMAASTRSRTRCSTRCAISSSSTSLAAASASFLRARREGLGGRSPARPRASRPCLVEQAPCPRQRQVWAAWRLGRGGLQAVRSMQNPSSATPQGRTRGNACNPAPRHRQPMLFRTRGCVRRGAPLCCLGLLNLPSLPPVVPAAAHSCFVRGSKRCRRHRMRSSGSVPINPCLSWAVARLNGDRLTELPLLLRSCLVDQTCHVRRMHFVSVLTYACMAEEQWCTPFG